MFSILDSLTSGSNLIVGSHIDSASTPSGKQLSLPRGLNLRKHDVTLLKVLILKSTRKAFLLSKTIN